MEKNIKKFFNETAKENNLNLNNKLSWGFYFSHKQSDNLQEAKNLLDPNRYSSSEIIFENKTYYLCVEEINVHNVDSLYNRCKEFQTLAEKLHINSFDGFDVEEIAVS